MNRFKIVMCGRGHHEWAIEALNSVAIQDDPKIDVCMVDDASPDERLFVVLTGYGEEHGWLYFRRESRAYALENQILAWNALEPEPDDVIIWVDLDDRLARADALSIVRGYYERGAELTYGSYRPFPEDHPNAASCRPAQPYDALTVNSRSYRKAPQWFNHLRTCSWRILRELSDDDLRRSDGEYFRANTDRAVMFPALEIAGQRAVYVPETLYEYRCNSEDAVWKTMNPELVAEDQELRMREKKGVLL